MSHLSSLTRWALPLVSVVLSLSKVHGEVLGADLVRRWAEAARTNHLGLRALDHRADAARIAVDATRRWSDPSVRVGATATGSRGPRTSEEGDLSVGFTQPLPVMGKESSRRAVAEEAAATSVVRVDARWVELRRDLAIGMAEAALAERLSRLRAEEARWLEQVEASLMAVQATRPSSASQVLRLSRDRLDAEVTSTNEWSRLRDARSQLNRMVGFPPEAEVGSMELPPVMPEVRFTPELVGLALRSEPRLRLARRESKEAVARVLQTRRTSRPDLSIGVDSRQYSGDAGLREATVTLSLSLPWANRANYRRDLKRELALQEAANLEVRDLETEVAAEVHHWVTAINTSGRENRVLTGRILPQIEASLELVRSQWSVGQAELRDLLELNRQRIDAEARAARSAADQWIAISQLLLCCGLDDLNAFLSSPDATSKPESLSRPDPTLP